jgi:hypothetical protein
MRPMRSLTTKLRHGYIRAKSYVGRPRTVIQVKPVVTSDGDVCSNPIFIIGVHRSGTSLLRRIINSHPAIACPPETYYLTHFAAMMRDRNTAAGFFGLGYQSREDWVNQIRIWSSRYHEAYRISHDKSRWADKTPQYSHVLPELKEIFGPGARFVFIIRNPLDVIYSIYSRGWDIRGEGGDLLSATARYVAETLEAQLDFLNQNPDICLEVRYEDLIREPEARLRTIFAFLGEPWDDRVLDYHLFDHNYGVEDPVVRGAVGFIENSGNWKALGEAQVDKVLSIAGGYVEKLGYKA